MHTRCKPGDLAVVVSAFNSTNIGRIVRVIAPHDRTGDLVYSSAAGPVWLVSSPQALTWRLGERELHQTSGPAPDSQLQPIRGDGPKAKRRSKRKAPIKQATPEVTA